MRVVAIGDSIVHGGLDHEGGGWVTRLKILSDARGQGDHVFGLGIGGNTSRDVLARADVEIGARTNHVDKVIFGVGTNDLNQDISLEEFKANLKKLGRIADRYGKMVYYMGLFRWVADGERVDNAGYDQMIQYVCSECGYTYIPTLDLIGDSDLEDGCHPNARGHSKLCARVAECIAD